MTTPRPVKMAATKSLESKPGFGTMGVEVGLGVINVCGRGGSIDLEDIRIKF